MPTHDTGIEMKQPGPAPGGTDAVSRVLLVTGVYPPQIGGPSQQTRLLARELLARGVAVQVVTQGAELRREVRDGIPLIYLPMTRQPTLLRKLAGYRAVYRQIRELIREFRPDVVHMQTLAGPLSLITGFAARRAGVASLVKYTGDPAAEMAFHDQPLPGAPASEPPPSRRGWLYRALLSVARVSVFHLYRRVWATTPALARQVCEQLRVPLSRVVLLPNFIDLDRFVDVARPPRDSGVDVSLLTVARLHPNKGIEVCLEALARLSDLRTRLRIVGSAVNPLEYEDFLRQRVRELGLEDRVEFVGALTPESLAREYALADAFVLGSFYEPFGLVVAEAMAAGLPVVVTAVGGLPHVVAHGGAGLLVPPGDPGAMAEAVRRLAGDGGLRERMVEAARDRSRDFGAGAGIDQLMHEYARLRKRGRT